MSHTHDQQAIASPKRKLTRISPNTWLKRKLTTIFGIEAPNKPVGNSSLQQAEPSLEAVQRNMRRLNVVVWRPNSGVGQVNFPSINLIVCRVNRSL